MIQRRASALYKEDADKARRKSHENPYIVSLYKEYLGEPCGAMSHKLLHTHYADRRPHLPENKAEELLAVCAQHNNDPGELINVLHAAQGLLGYIPEEAQEVIASGLNLPVSKVYGVVSFYSFFTMKPKGKYPVSVCMGTACYVRGAEKVLDEFQRQLDIKVGETTKDGLFSIDCLRCVGACGLAPVAMIGDRVYGRITPEKVGDILSEYYTKEG
ncbi:MAG: NAD(P)H-dependent oxidoreductase subunit E [Tannerellaceae bacterium]|nr:NAD(P)H-dependent oxidoreductase subunit E [Tannerellaceae bacterium]